MFSLRRLLAVRDEVPLIEFLVFTIDPLGLATLLGRYPSLLVDGW